MGIAEAGLVLSGISALSSVVQAFKAAFDIGKEMSEEDMDRVLSSINIAPSAAEAFESVIGDEALADLLEEINGHVERLRRTFRDRKMPNHEKKGVFDRVDRDICFVLETIKRYNNRVLPDLGDPDLNKMWDRHGCK